MKDFLTVLSVIISLFSISVKVFAQTTQPNTSEPSQHKTIFDAARSGDLATVTALIERNPDLASSKDDEGFTPLHYAAILKKPVLVCSCNMKELAVGGGGVVIAADGVVDKLAVITSSGSESEIELESNKLGVEDGHEVIFTKEYGKILVNNVGITGGGNFLLTPLQIEKLFKVDGPHDYDGVIKILLTNKADINSMNNDGWTPLLYAANWGRIDIVKLLVANKADVNAKNKDGWTPLLYAASLGSTDMAKFLIANNANVNVGNHDGRTPLMFAVTRSDWYLTALLLAKNADINARDKDGCTALILSTRQDDPHIAQNLIYKNADITIKNNDGRTALDEAKRCGNKLAAVYLRSGFDTMKILNGDVKDFMKLQQPILDRTTLLAKKPKDKYSEDDKKVLADLVALQDKLSAFIKDAGYDISQKAKYESELHVKKMAYKPIADEILHLSEELATATDALKQNNLDIASTAEKKSIDTANSLIHGIGEGLSHPLGLLTQQNKTTQESTPTTAPTAPKYIAEPK